MWRSKRLIIPLLIAIGMMLTVGVVYGALSNTNVVYLWDAPAGQYESGNAEYPLNGTWQSVLHKIGLDPGPSLVEIPITYAVGGCAPPNNYSYYAEYIEMGLAFEDHTAELGQAFQESRRWELIDCDRNGDGTGIPDNADRYEDPQQKRETIRCAYGLDCQYWYTSEQTFTEDKYGLWLERKDDVQPCNSGQCSTQLVTLLFGNLDTDCDGTPEITGDGGICFYAEGRLPPPTNPPTAPMWLGSNVQVRIRVGGGQKTVNMATYSGSPTAVILKAFAAKWAEASSQPVILWAAIAVAGAGAVGALVWRLRLARR